jgi:hypothetical protein
MVSSAGLEEITGAEPTQREGSREGVGRCARDQARKQNRKPKTNTIKILISKSSQAGTQEIKAT